MVFLHFGKRLRANASLNCIGGGSKDGVADLLRDGPPSRTLVLQELRIELGCGPPALKSLLELSALLQQNTDAVVLAKAGRFSEHTSFPAYCLQDIVRITLQLLQHRHKCVEAVECREMSRSNGVRLPIPQGI